MDDIFNNYESIQVLQICDKDITQSDIQYSLTIYEWDKQIDMQFSCNKCEYKTTSNRSLSPHIQIKHEPFKYRCENCNYKAITQSILEYHKQNKDKEGQLIYDNC